MLCAFEPRPIDSFMYAIGRLTKEPGGLIASIVYATICLSRENWYLVLGSTWNKHNYPSDYCWILTATASSLPTGQQEDISCVYGLQYCT